MHRAALVIFISCFLWNCGERVPNNDIERSIRLANDLGTVKIWLPARFDTSFTWKDMSDYSCGDKVKTRWADSRYSLEQESGAFYFSKPDSLYQFTVSQNLSSGCPLPADLIVGEEWLQLRRDHYKAIDVNIEFDADTVEEINGKDFIITGFQQRRGDTLHIAKLEALTMIERQIVQMHFYCYSKDCSGFIDSMYVALRTVEFREKE